MVQHRDSPAKRYSPRTDRLADSVERLMQTLALTVKGDEEERTQLLGSFTG